MQRAWAGVVIGGPGAALGFDAALYLSNLAPPPERIVVFVRPTAGFPAHDHRWRFIRAERNPRGTPPRTRLEEAIIDVGRSYSADAFVSLVGRAVTDRLVTVAGLRDALDQRTRTGQRRLMDDILDDVASGLTSALERRYHRGVERAHGLPAARHQSQPAGVHKTDNTYEAYGVIVEVDGRGTHQGLAAVRDIERDNRHMLKGIYTLRFTWGHVVEEPCRTARLVAGALRAGGWTGVMRPCRFCGGQ